MPGAEDPGQDVGVLCHLVNIILRHFNVHTVYLTAEQIRELLSRSQDDELIMYLESTERGFILSIDAGFCKAMIEAREAGYGADHKGH